jgi:hypothetical protein
VNVAHGDLLGATAPTALPSPHAAAILRAAPSRRLLLALLLSLVVLALDLIT